MKTKKGIIIQKLGELFVVYDNETGTLFEFNEVGYFILNLIKKGKSINEILKSITRHFEVSQDDAKKDLNNFLKELKKRGLIETK